MSATTAPKRAQTPSERITVEVTSWDGVVAGPGSRGEFAFKIGRREIGHLHGDHAAHFFFPRETWRELYDEGRIAHHPVFPEREGPAARRIARRGSAQAIQPKRVELKRAEAQVGIRKQRVHGGLAALHGGMSHVGVGGGPSRLLG